jgi:hypothetical protein
MAGFTELFLSKYEETYKVITTIKDAIGKSGNIVGVDFSFDLETLLSVLNDLAGVKSEKPISVPTACLLISENLNIKQARDKYGSEALQALEKLTAFIFSQCIQPIKTGKEAGNFSLLDRFYGPLMTVLNKTGLESIQRSIRHIYSTNWDLCFKTWADWTGIPINEGIDIDEQSIPILAMTKYERGPSNGFIYMPLHGSLDLVKMKRFKGKGNYEDILKQPDALRYFEGKTDAIRDVFIIYPLEAVGYEESIKSPYFDMLFHLRSSLTSNEENVVFIIGYSLRDPTIGSIFEEVIAERIRKGDLAPLSKNLESRKTEASNHRFKVIVINPEPDTLAKNLEKQFNTNLLQTFIPIRLEFPKVESKDFEEKYSQLLSQLIQILVHVRYMEAHQAKSVANILNTKYGLSVRSQDFE